LYYSDYYPLEAINAEETTNALATKQDTKIGIHDLLNIKNAINEVDTKIYKLKDQFIEFHHKINRFDEQITDLEAQKLQLTDKFNKGKLTASD
jgi:archaellum component FlaC